MSEHMEERLEKQFIEYQNPLTERYTSKEMSFIFSPKFKFSTWRKLWVALAEAEKEQGFPIEQEQIDEMKKYVEKIDFVTASQKEKEVRHDVMAHVHTFASQCPKAAGIIHLGATSAYVGDNTDLIQIKEATILIKKKLLQVLNKLKSFAIEYKDLPCLGFTHFQPAQLTTVGKRGCLWLQELMLDCEEVDFFHDTLPFRGVKGTTGTQASFMKLFDNDEKKVKAIESYVMREFGFARCLTITGQTYTRKIDAKILNLLSNIAQSASKMATDIRLLQNKKELEEPFEKNQIGSSAMAYKRNPMRTERICSLSRFVMSLTNSTSYTSSTQWFERTLDDSANKRLAIPQAFMAVDAILDIMNNVSDGIVVYPKVIRKNIDAELPFMMTENILMEGVQNGKNRQDLHEKIRQHSLVAAAKVKQEGEDNPLLELITQDKEFSFMDQNTLQKLNDPSQYTGRSSELTEEFVSEVETYLAKQKHFEPSENDVELRV